MLPGRELIEHEWSESLADAIAEFGLLSGLCVATHIISVFSQSLFAPAHRNFIDGIYCRSESIGSASRTSSA